MGDERTQEILTHLPRPDPIVPLDSLESDRAEEARRYGRLTRDVWGVTGKKPHVIGGPNLSPERWNVLPYFDLHRAGVLTIARDKKGWYFVVPNDYLHMESDRAEQ